MHSRAHSILLIYSLLIITILIILVGGEMLDFFLTRLNQHAKIVVCGAISDYNSSQPRGIQNYLTLISMRATMQGFIVYVPLSLSVYSFASVIRLT